jgi:hypothetical protein
MLGGPLTVGLAELAITAAYETPWKNTYRHPSPETGLPLPMPGLRGGADRQGIRLTSALSGR